MWHLKYMAETLPNIWDLDAFESFFFAVTTNHFSFLFDFSAKLKWVGYMSFWAAKGRFHQTFTMEPVGKSCINHPPLCQ